MRIQRKAIAVFAVLFSIFLQVPYVRAQVSPAPPAPAQQDTKQVRQDPALDAISAEWERIFEIIDANYLEPIDHRACYEKTQSKGLSACLDKYSGYLTAKAWEEMHNRMNGQYAGVGMALQRDKNVVRVFPYPGRPAAKAGILPYDILLKVDSTDVVQDHDYTEDDLYRVAQLIRGQPGTIVQITVRRGDENIGPLSVTRANINLASVMYQKLAPNVGYVKIDGFGDTTAWEFLEALKALTDNGNTPMFFIFDLRGNGGGLMNAALSMLNMLSPKEGKLMLTMQTKGSTKSWATQIRGPFRDAHGVILVNGSTASASEIFAGTLQDWGNFKLVGEHTFGKGIGQSIIPLWENKKDSPLVKLTTFRYLVGESKTPVLTDKGLKPDTEVSDKLDNPEEMKEFQEDFKKHDPTKLYINLKFDKQLAKALELALSQQITPSK